LKTDIKSLVGKKIEVTIEKLAVGGSGIARHRFSELELDRDLVIFVPNTAPGDVCEVSITTVEKTFLLGHLESILKPSASRIVPICIVANECGGCTWQHVSYDEQVRQKELILSDLFKKFLKGIECSLLPTKVSQNQFAYRNRIQIKQKGSQFGYFKKGSHDIVEIDQCPIAEKAVSDQIAEIKKSSAKNSELTKWEIKRTQADQVEFYKIGDKGEGLAFAQVNSEINNLLVETVASFCLASNPSSITELYAGAGNFTFPISKLLPQTEIRAVELNPELTKNAVEQAKAKKSHKKVLFFTTSCDAYVASQNLSKDLILLDPPRSGCNPAVINHVAWAAPKRIVYVSCHPVNLARDVARILQIQPNYKVQTLQIFDMFPQTDHFETLCILSL